MKLRPILFWSHLAAGLAAGIFVFIMAVSGVLVTYEHAIIDRVASATSVPVPADESRLAVDELAAIAEPRSEGARMVMLSFRNRADAPVTVYQIGKGQFALDPYSGIEVDNPASRVEGFFHEIIDWHRWLGLEGDGRAVGKAIMGAANLAFLFLVVTGIYLWLPRVWKWPFFRKNLVFGRQLPTSKARDYNWHHVFGFWALVPLFFIVVSGVVISYPWANAMLYQAFGEQAPRRQGPAFLSGNGMDSAADGNEKIRPQDLATLEQAFEAARATDDSWTKINLIVPPDPQSPTVRVLVNNSGGILPMQRTTLIFDRVASEIRSSEGYDDMTSGQKARMFMRFVHTGEQFGLVGSTIAGLATLAACFLVYSGFALSYRRLVQPYFRRRMS
jgi:uncharacterized iron-regulated membrane protein